MHMSHEEFERYMAQQDAELAAKEPVRKPTSNDSSPLSLLVYTIPFFLVLGITYCCWNTTTKMPASKKTSTWDKMLGFTAGATGRKYDANANSLTERLTFRKKK